MDELPVELQDYIFMKTDFRTCLQNNRDYAANQLAKRMSFAEHLACLKTSPDPKYFKWLYNCKDFCHTVLFRRLLPTRMAYFVLKRCMVRGCHTFSPQMTARTWGKWGTISEIETFLETGLRYVDDVLDGACMRRDADVIFDIVPCTESGVMSLILAGNVRLLANITLPVLDDFAKIIGSIRAVESRSIAMIAYVLDNMSFPKVSDMYIYCYGDIMLIRFLYLKKIPMPMASEVIRHCSLDVLHEMIRYGMILDEACYACCTKDYEKLVFLQKHFCPFPGTLFIQYYSGDPNVHDFFARKPISYTYFYWHDMIHAMRREQIDEDRVEKYLFSPENDEIKLFYTVGKYANIPFIQRLIQKGLTPEQKYEIARGSTRVGVLDMLWPFELQPALLTQALMYEKWDIFHWLIRKKCPVDTLVLQELNYKGDLRLKKFLDQLQESQESQDDVQD